MNDHEPTVHGGDGHEPVAGPAFPPPAGAMPPAAQPGKQAQPAQADQLRQRAQPPEPGRQPAGPPDVEQLADLVYERLAAKLGQQPGRPDHPSDMPAVDEAVALRERAPELYDLWLKIAQDRAATGNYVRRAPYEVPERLAQSGRPRAVSSLIVVLAFCGYLAWLGGPGPYIAGLIAVLDLIVMLGLFFGLRPEHLSGTRRPPGKR